MQKLTVKRTPNIVGIYLFTVYNILTTIGMGISIQIKLGNGSINKCNQDDTNTKIAMDLKLSTGKIIAKLKVDPTDQNNNHS